MAVIKIKTIKNNLQAVINYAKNGAKTDNEILVSGINCIPPFAYEQMALTKKFYHKENKTKGFHIIQSFNGNELSPEKANRIGKELATELWGDTYQVLICTHINKSNVHNHIILNSVSFVDGKKYHNSNAEIAIMRDSSDKLCLKYGLSIVETEKAKQEKFFRQKRIDNFNRIDEKMQKIKNDIDEAIKSAKKYSVFKLELNAKGYEINGTGKYLSVKTPYFSRRVRVDKSFGEKYSVFGIKERIYYKTKEKLPVANLNKKYYKKIYTGPKINKLLLQTSSLYRLYVHYLYVFKILPKKNEYKKLTPEYFKYKKENEKIFEEINFMGRNSFKSIQELKDYKNYCENKLPELKSKRENLWRKYNMLSDEANKIKIKQEIDILSEEIKYINKNSKICGRCSTKLKKFATRYKKRESTRKIARKLINESNKKNVRANR